MFPSSLRICLLIRVPHFSSFDGLIGVSFCVPPPPSYCQLGVDSCLRNVRHSRLGSYFIFFKQPSYNQHRVLVFTREETLCTNATSNGDFRPLASQPASQLSSNNRRRLASTISCCLLVPWGICHFLTTKLAILVVEPAQGMEVPKLQQTLQPVGGARQG